MGIFGSTHSQTELPVFEGYTAENNGDLLALQEAHSDYFEINNSIHALEMKELAVTESAGYDDEAVLEKLGGNVLAKIKKFFVDFAAKIRAYFQSLVGMVDGLFRSGESFIKKYEPIIQKRDTKGLKVKLLKYTNMDVSKIVNSDLNVNDELTKFLDDAATAAKSKEKGAHEKIAAKTVQLRDHREEFLAELRGKQVGKNKLTKAEYAEALYTHYRGDHKPKHDIPEVEFDLGVVAENLKSSKVAKDIKKAADAYKKTADSLIKKVDEAIKSIESAHKDRKDKDTVEFGNSKLGEKNTAAALDALRATAATEKAQKAITLEAIRALKAAVSERTNHSKSACLKALSYKPEKK